MISLLYESSIILGCTYGFYYFFLRKSKAFGFIRFFFLAAILVALIIPFVDLEYRTSLPLAEGVGFEQFYSLAPLTSNGTSVDQGQDISFRSVLLIIYLLGFSLMFLRFVFNLVKLLLISKQSETIASPSGRIIFTEIKGLPYSFFGNIYMNRDMYNRGNEIEKLLLHEAAHCKQFHSMDILLSEGLKVLLWFNPFVWLLTNAVRLNHEYLADSKVLESENPHTYQLLLINLELANQPISLASDFNYSLTQKRLNMINNKKRVRYETLRKLGSFPLFLILAATLTFCEAEKEPELDPNQSMEFYANDWWRPILSKHNIAPKAYNNFEDIFEMGSTNSINENKVVTLKDAFFLIRKDKSKYSILRSPLATHDLNTGIIEGEEGTLESYDLFQEEPEVLGQLEMKNFKYQLIENKHNVSADYMVFYEQGKETLKGWTTPFEAKDSLILNRIGE